MRTFKKQLKNTNINLAEDDSNNAKKCTKQSDKMDFSNSLSSTDSNDSFYSNAELEDLLSGDDAVRPPFETISKIAYQSSSDSSESLFCDINESSSIEETASRRQSTRKRCEIDLTPKEAFLEEINEKDLTNLEFKDIFQTVDDEAFVHKDLKLQQEVSTDIKAELDINDTIFNHINVNNLTNREVEDIFQDDDADLPLEQNTQMFLNAVAFKIPNAPAKKENSLNTSLKERSVHGTQYKTSEELRCEQSQVLVNQELAALNDCDWETQAFDGYDSCPSKSNFYGLPDRVKDLIFEHKGIASLYEWQDECLNLPAIRKRKNLIYALPTSGGKTLVAEILMLRELLCREKNVLFILPYVSIVQEKVSAMSPFAIALDFIVDEYTAGKGKFPSVARRKRKSLFIASIEKGAVLLDSLIEVERPHEIGLVVVDELHLIGEKGRGATLEAFLTKIMFLNANIQIVGMSATIGNLNEISAFLNADVYTRSFRPVELKEYIKCGRDLLEINAQGETLEEIFVYNRSVDYKYSTAVARADPDHLAGLVSECAPEHCCLIFCSSRKNCENVSQLLSRILPQRKFLEHRKSEKLELMDALDKICGILSPVLAKTLPYGIAYHHSGLTTEERKYIENAYRLGILSVICCTSTLAAGVNLPAKRVIIRAPYVGQEFMTLCKYKQMVGRAGRAGMGEAGESILITQSLDNVRVGEMLFSPMDKAYSSLHQQEALGLQALILSVIGLNLADCRRDLLKLINSSLMAVQTAELGINIESLILDILRNMFKHKVLKIVTPADPSNQNCSLIISTQDDGNVRNAAKVPRLFITKSTRFELTDMGRAAFKAGIDYRRCFAIHKELKLAQQQLILTNYAHLLYLIVSFNSNELGDELFAADASRLFESYTALDAEKQALFRLLGFTEAHAARLIKTNSVQGHLALQMNRLYKVLVLLDILDVQPLPNVADKFNIERGMLQHLISQSAGAASAIVRLCEEIQEFWCFKSLFERITQKMDRCGSVELEALLELPAVKINRAKQLYAAGFKTMEDIAKLRPMMLVKSVEHMPLKIAKEIISAAKIILMKRLDHLEEETEALRFCLQNNCNASQN